MKLAKFSAKFRRSLEGDFRASFPGENRQKHFPPKLHKFHHQTSLRGSGLWRALEIFSSKPKRPGEKGVPRNHPEISSQKLADFQCRFPYDSYGRQSTILALFGRRTLGQYPAAPCSPGPIWFTVEIYRGGHWKRGIVRIVSKSQRPKRLLRLAFWHKIPC